MKRNDTRLLAGLILFVVGAAGFAYGIITWNTERATLVNSIRHSLQLGASSEETQSLVFMIAGAAVGVIGLLLLIVRRRRR
jgi:LPXTG-motif cell wall-anchored protein